MMKLTKTDQAALLALLKLVSSSESDIARRVSGAEIIEDEPEVWVPPDRHVVLVGNNHQFIRKSTGTLDGNGALLCYSDGDYTTTKSWYKWKPLEAQWIDNTGANPAPGRDVFFELADEDKNETLSDNLRWKLKGLTADIKRCIILPED